MPSYDREATTRRIFDAAIQEFADHGIAGARVDDIAATAQSNKALIYSYFGTKEQLFARVLQERLNMLAAAVEVDPGHVALYVGDLFDFMTANPELLRLVQHEASHFSPEAVPDREARVAHYREKVAAVATAQAAGQVDPGLDPRFIVMSLVSLVSWFVAAPQITEMVMDQEVDESLRLAYREHLVVMAERMLSPVSR